MRTSLADFRKTECHENGDDLTRFKNRDVAHRLGNCDVLHSDKLGLQIRLAIFEKHGNDFLEVAVKLVESFTLRMGAREPRDKPHKKFGLGTVFNYCRVSSHE